MGDNGISKNIVHFLPADAGDCVVVQFDNKDCIIIDCGFKSTYHNELKPLLNSLKKQGCKIALLIVSHIDRDHIEGAVEFIKDNGNAKNPQIIEVENIWFNGFFNTLFLKDIFRERRNKDISVSQKKQFRLVKAKLGMLTYTGTGNISAKQSRCFEELCSINEYNLNSQFQDRVVKYNNEDSNEVLIGDCAVSLLAPNEKMLCDLANEFNKAMIKEFGRDYSLTDNFEFAEFFELLLDLHKEEISHSSYISAKGNNIENWIGTSSMAKMNVVNMASIVVEIKYKNYRLLFTGDSDSDYWSNHLHQHYDVIKISHHGTTKPNVKLVEGSKARHTLISTNGKRYGHPEKELIARLIMGEYNTLHFNYDLDIKKDIDVVREKYNFATSYCNRRIILD